MSQPPGPERATEQDGGTRLVGLSELLLALAKEQRDALQRGSVQQLDWLTFRLEQAMATMRNLSGEARPDEAQLARLKELAAEFEAVRVESSAAFDRLFHRDP